MISKESKISFQYLKQKYFKQDGCTKDPYPVPFDECYSYFEKNPSVAITSKQKHRYFQRDVCTEHPYPFPFDE